MPAQIVYDAVFSHLKQFLDPCIDLHSLRRIGLLVFGIIRARSASPAQIAKALHSLGLTDASPESVERRIRRLENDADLDASLCLHPLARAHLALGKPSLLRLAVDPTSQEDRIVLLTVGVCYRGRLLPLAFSVWEANTPLTEERFWERVDQLLGAVESLLPEGVPVLVVADRAFGTPAFIDLVTCRGWHYLVRVQGHTRLRDHRGIVRAVASMVNHEKRRVKRRGEVFKKRGFRAASVVVYWGRRHKGPLCLVTDLRPAWELIYLYRGRYAVETHFRDYKSAGWQWEKGQVTKMEHLRRLLVGMALACWITVLAGTLAAEEWLNKEPTGRRRTRPPEAKESLFTLGLSFLDRWMGRPLAVTFEPTLVRWPSPNWSCEIKAHHVRAYVFGKQTCPSI